MHNKILIFVIFILFFLISTKCNKQKIIDQKPSNDWVVSLNNQTKKIKKIYAEMVLRSSIFSKKGFICYEKQQNFRFSLPNKIEIGSNEKFIWFWSNDLIPDALYFCDNKKIKQSRLKKIFYPDNIRQMLGISEINDKNLKVLGDSIEITELDDNIEKVTIIKQNGISEYLLYENKILILQIKIKTLQKINDLILPKTIEINWILEKVQFELELKEVKVNNFEYKDWEIPNYKSKIDLSNY